MRIATLVLAVSTICHVYAAAPDEHLEDVTVAGGIYVELAGSAARWLEAVRRADVDTLVEVSLPEARAHTREALGASDSVLSQLLLSGRHAVRRRFQKVERPGIRLLSHPSLRGLGDGTDACFFDPKRPPSSMPQTVQTLPRPDIAQPHFCLFFFRADGQWFASYAFADDPEN